MNDQARHAIPSRLDDPERWLFWTLDEAAALLGPALLGAGGQRLRDRSPGRSCGLGPAAPGQAGRRCGCRDLRALLVPARLRAGTQGCAAEPPAPIHRMRRPQ